MNEGVSEYICGTVTWQFDLKPTTTTTTTTTAKPTSTYETKFNNNYIQSPFFGYCIGVVA